MIRQHPRDPRGVHKVNAMAKDHGHMIPIASETALPMG